MRDVMCSGYVAGGNTRFFGAPTGGFGEPAVPENVRNDIEARLSFQNENDGEYGSMIAFCAPYGDGAKYDQVISISDRLLPWEVNQNPTEKKYFPGGDANFKAARNVLALHTIHFGEDVRAAENMEFISQVRIAKPTHTLHTHSTHCSVASTDAHLYVVCRAA